MRFAFALLPAVSALIHAQTRPPALVAVALSGADSIVLLDAATLDRKAMLPVGRNPHEIVASSDGRTLYVANAGESSISVLDLSGHPRVRARWRLPDSISVHDVALAPDGILWAVSGRTPTLLGIDTSTGVARHRYALSRPGSWMVDTRGPDARVIVTNLEGGAVTLVAPGTGLETVIPGNEGEIDAIATPDLREIWSANVATGDLTVFDSRSGRQVANGGAVRRPAACSSHPMDGVLSSCTAEIRRSRRMMRAPDAWSAPRAYVPARR